MSKKFQLHLGEQLQIELADYRHCKAVVQFVRDREIWTRKFIEPDLGLEGSSVNIRIIREQQIRLPKYPDKNQNEDAEKSPNCNICLQFKGLIRKNEILQGLEMTKIEQISEISRLQRRKTYRLKMSFDVLLRSREDMGEYKRCRGVDISEAGIGVRTNCRAFKMGDAVDCIFKLEETEYYFPATVVGRNDCENGCRLGIKFNIEKNRQIYFIRRLIYKNQTSTIDW